MSHRILHVLDSTTPGDALDMVALLTGVADPLLGEWRPVHRILALGHRSTADVAALAGIGKNTLTFVRSAGWADPMGWRGLKKVMRDFQPTHLQAWGAPAAIAVLMSGFSGRCVFCFADVPTGHHHRMLRRVLGFVHRPEARDAFVASSGAIAEVMHSAIPWMIVREPGIPLDPPTSAADIAALKKSVGLRASDGPVVLLGGEGRNARYDVGIWTVAILQHLFPEIRAVVREDSRHQANQSLERFIHTLADENMLVVAPPDMAWKRLVHVADILLVPAVEAIPVGSILAAMAGGVPVVATPGTSIRGLLEDERDGLIGGSAAPRALAGALEKLLSAPPLGVTLAENARKRIAADFRPAEMIGGFADLYVRTG